jgi:hypothetical protein
MSVDALRQEIARLSTTLERQTKGQDTPTEGQADVYFIEDLARELRTSVTTLRRLRRYGVCPIEELPSLDKRPRWSGEAVRRYLAYLKQPRFKPLRGPLPLRSIQISVPSGAVYPSSTVSFAAGPTRSGRGSEGRAT